MILCVTLTCHAQNFLLKARRSQEAPFNLACPYYKYDDGHLSEKPCVVGCVATALEHIINYWRFPESTLTEIPELTTPNYSLSPVPAATIIDWNNMQEDYLDQPYSESSAKAVADLSLYLGQAVRMKYTENSSGASTRNVPQAMKDVFGFRTAHLCYRSDYTVEKWERLLQNEFACGRPVYYSGHTFLGNGHAWVLDGYDAETGLYHCRWDEGNIRDGWYSLDFLNEFENACDNVPGDEVFGCTADNSCVILSPDDIDLSFALDTIPYDELKLSTGHLYGVDITEVRFLRPLSTDNAVMTEVRLRNLTENHFRYTAEALVSRSSEDFVDNATLSGLFSITLSPHCDTTVIVPLIMPLSGDVYFAITPDGVDLYCQRSIKVSSSHKPSLSFDDIEVSFPEEGVAELTCKVHNLDYDHFNGNYFMFWLLTHEEALYGSDANTQSVRYAFSNMQPSSDTTFVARFHQLETGESYQLWLRQNWPVVMTADFTVPEDPTSFISLQMKEVEENQNTYSLSGQRIQPRPGELYIRNRRKYIR